MLYKAGILGLCIRNIAKSRIQRIVIQFKIPVVFHIAVSQNKQQRMKGLLYAAFVLMQIFFCRSFREKTVPLCLGSLFY